MYWGEFLSNYSYAGGYLLDPFGSWRLSAQSPPQTPAEPITLASIKKYLHIVDGPTPDTDQDDTLTEMLAPARRVAEYWQASEFVRRQYDLSYDYWPGLKIPLRNPTQSVDLIQFKDFNGAVTTLTENVDYIVDTNKRVPIIKPMYNKQWPFFTPWPSSAILIRLTCGYAPDDPWWQMDGAHLIRGMHALVSFWYNNRDAFTRGIGNIEEYPFMVTQLLGLGAIPIVG